jgi:hypothetical protein
MCSRRAEHADAQVDSCSGDRQTALDFLDSRLETVPANKPKKGYTWDKPENPYCRFRRSPQKYAEFRDLPLPAAPLENTSWSARFSRPGNFTGRN